MLENETRFSAFLWKTGLASAVDLPFHLLHQDWCPIPQTLLLPYIVYHWKQENVLVLIQYSGTVQQVATILVAMARRKKKAAKVTNLTTCFRQSSSGILFLLVELMIFPQLKWNENLGEIIFMLYFLYNSSLLPWFPAFNYSGDHIDVNT